VNQVPTLDRDAVISAASPALQPLRFIYADIPAQAALAAADTLAVLAFGPRAPDLADTRYLRVGLRPLQDEGRIEVWKASGPVRSGRDGNVRWSADADWLFGTIELAEDAHGGIAAASAVAYRELCEFTARSGHLHVLRIWNYLEGINRGDGDDERYRWFCRGRAEGIGHGCQQSFPAASAIGRSDGVQALQVYWLAARSAGNAVENPRQMSAWRYPRQYGPAAPIFARAMHAPTPAAQLHVSGTAAVVGHASQHDNDLAAQIAETFANLQSLFSSAGAIEGFGSDSLVKIYVRRPQDAASVMAAMDALLPPMTPRLVLEGDICRRELLVEIDGVLGAVHQAPLEPSST
jgi:chorismate lyase/3-hydroxybenzoate synthase